MRRTLAVTAALLLAPAAHADPAAEAAARVTAGTVSPGVVSPGTARQPRAATAKRRPVEAIGGAASR